MIFPLLVPSLILARIFSPGLRRVFQCARSSPKANLRRAAEFTLLWAAVGSVPPLLLAFHGNVSLVTLAGSLLPGIVLGLIGTAILTIVIPAGSKNAPVTGVVIGGGLPAVILWALAVIPPKNEAPMGYFLFGFILAVPNAIAGAIAGVWRSKKPISLATNTAKLSRT
jgi:hypothetical protein